MALDLVQLRSFVEVTERGTVAAAAAELGYTAPAVSQHLSKLETELGTPLFDRVAGRLRPTPAGVALVALAFEMLDLDERARAAVRSPLPTPVIRVAGFASAISAVLTPKLTAIEARVAVEISEMEDVDALRELRLGAIDVALVQEYDGDPIGRDDRLEYRAVDHDELTLVVPSDRSDRTRVEQLAAARWLLNGRGTRCAAATLRVLAERGIEPRVAGVVGDNATLLSLVAAGFGVTVVPSGVIDRSRPGITIARQRLGVGRTTFAVTRAATNRPIMWLVDALAAT